MVATRVMQQGIATSAELVVIASVWLSPGKGGQSDSNRFTAVVAERVLINLGLRRSFEESLTERDRWTSHVHYQVS